MANEIALAKQQVASKRAEMIEQFVLLHEYIHERAARVRIRQIDHVLEL